MLVLMGPDRLTILKVRASTSSTRYMSLEKRFKTRPEGVVSKKLIGDRKIAYAIRSWNLRDAYGLNTLAVICKL